MQRLELLKALGDNTRYAIYLEIARSASPRSTSDIAEILGLHPNTVRPHLERMRDVGLLHVEIDGRGTVGRPQHRYAIAEHAPSLGLEPPAFPALASMLAAVAVQGGPSSEDVAEVGRTQGRVLAARDPHRSDAPSGHLAGDVGGCVASLAAHLDLLGFDPAVATSETGCVVAFTHCPYRELAETYPQLVCQLHRGMVEGLLEGFTSEDDDETMVVDWFHNLAEREPCQVGLRHQYSSA